MRHLPGLLLSLLFTAVSTPAMCGGVADTYVGYKDFSVRPSHYDYAVTIDSVDPEMKELTLKIQCDQCKRKSATLTGCRISSTAPDFAFSCKGENWHVNYRLDGDVLTGEGVTKRGKAYKVKLKRAPSVAQNAEAAPTGKQQAPQEGKP